MRANSFTAMATHTFSFGKSSRSFSVKKSLSIIRPSTWSLISFGMSVQGCIVSTPTGARAVRRNLML